MVRVEAELYTGDGQKITSQAPLPTSAPNAEAALGATGDSSSTNTIVGLLKNLKAALAGILSVKQQATTVAYGAATVGTGPAVLIRAANAARYFIAVYNNGTVPVYVGSDTSVTTANGYPIPSGESRSFACTTDIYGISGTAGQDVRWFAETA